MRFELISIFAGLSAAAVLPVPSTTSPAVPATTPFSASKGFTIPSHHTDGTYMVEIDSNGNEVHTKISTKPSISKNTKETSPRQLTRRVDPVPNPFPNEHPTACAGFGECNPSDALAAAKGLGDLCDIITHAVSPKTPLYSISGEVAFYFCNFSNSAQQCSSKLVDDALDIIHDGACGEAADQGGWYNLPNGNSYGYQLKDQSFCGWGTGH